jgi:hypothetical protein
VKMARSMFAATSPTVLATSSALRSSRPGWIPSWRMLGVQVVQLGHRKVQRLRASQSRICEKLCDAGLEVPIAR